MGRPDFVTLTWLAGLPDLSMLLGMIVVQFVTPGKRLESLFQHFGAGVVLCAVSTEILPLLLTEEHSNLADYIGIAAGFVVGVVSMLLIARIGPDHEAVTERQIERTASRMNLEAGLGSPENPPIPSQGTHSELEVAEPSGGAAILTDEASSLVSGSSRSGNSVSGYGRKVRCKAIRGCWKRLFGSIPWGMVVPVTTDATMDGLLIGIAFVAGSTESGLVMSIALAIEMCFLGISTSLNVKAKRVPLVIAIPMCIILPQFIVAAAFAGATILASLSGALFVAVLSFGVAALLFLVSDELLVEAHRDEESDVWWVTVFFFLGFASVIVLQKVSDAITKPKGVISSSSAFDF